MEFAVEMRGTRSAIDHNYSQRGDAPNRQHLKAADSLEMGEISRSRPMPTNYRLNQPWNDLRWWWLILPFALLVCWLFLYFQQASVIVELVKVLVAAIGGFGLKAIYDDCCTRQSPRS